MNVADLGQIGLYLAIVLALTPVIGWWMVRVFEGARLPLAVVENGLYRLARIDPTVEQSWQRYAMAVLVFNFLGILFLYLVLRLQGWLPLNPAGLPSLAPDLAFGTAISFTTNTNWQAYGGESTMSYLAQMLGLTVQNFLSAATGIVVAIAVIRGFVRARTKTLGNFWVDLTRCVLYLLLPLAIVVALVLVWQGVPQNVGAYVTATTLEGASQTMAQGPAASQVAIKQLGTNGGGFFSVNSAHPYENPTPLSNMVQMVAILAIPAAFAYAFGVMAKNRRQGWAIFAAMALLFVAGLGVVYANERLGNPAFASFAVDQADGNMEGKEVRFGVVNSAIWATATTAASNGSVNSMHASYAPLSSLVLLFNMLTGEVIFGGVGAGFYGMLVYAVLTVFLAGLMVGRTPEYLGKKIEAREVKLAVLAFLAMPIGVLGGAALTVMLPGALASVQDPGPHGFSEILYAYASATGNNGSAFAGFDADTPYHNTGQGLAMLLGRFAFILPLLAIAGALAAKQPAPASAGTFPTDGPLFVVLLVAVIVVVGGLTFFPALALGPIAEHLALASGRLF